ncbi:hypothetical protein ACH41E_11345 [Streptomyces sp. NPDC020412]|uniref:hypothetical protein n=1 Tax=Streptomyces sp. NPDC020412 TaxID=3365073 RepID=UPI00378D0CCF
MHDGPVLRTNIGDRAVDLPASLDGIRASLPEDQREEFDREIGSALITDIPLIAARWSLPQEARDEDEAMLQQLRNGDFSGFTGLDEPSPAGAGQ